jgi:formylglycine-generating enzyme required for sulfatase activity
MVDENFLNLLNELKSSAAKSDLRNFRKSLVSADSVKPTQKVSGKKSLAGMVFVPAAKGISFEIEHIRGECGCYADTAAIEANDAKFGFGFGLSYSAAYPYVIHQPIKHKIAMAKTKPFFIDETEATNSQFKKFLDSTGYQPAVKDNFLAHWPNGIMPAELADYPVVYVDIDDARAYAKWAHKRLPTESEWQLAAQGTDSRKWPWGNDFDRNKCNTTGKLQPANSYPKGASPYGCLNMSGNVWEWTESCRDDGHTRFTMIRGGSYFDAQGSIWYVKGGPQPAGSHIKFVRIWQGLDRCATIGFRCVVDAK